MNSQDNKRTKMLKINIDVHKIILSVVLGMISLKGLESIEKYIIIVEKQKENAIISQAQEDRETLKLQYLLEKQKTTEEHKNVIDLLQVKEQIDNESRAINYENDYQLKNIELKRTILQTCSKDYETSEDFLKCITNVLKEQNV